MGITSYAQNFEDVMLWRALGHIPNGLYIDVGAQHPIVDSVSKAFYEHGWRGIHVEPTTTYANLLRADRPDEVVIQAALSNHPGTVQFYEIAETGLSTADSAIAARHQEQGFGITETIVPCMTLADVFNLTADKDIHWLKVDVEGFERQVLEGWGNASALPWIIVVESTLPLTTIETHENWEALLLERGYQASYFDGLNRYYLAPTHPELQTSFQAGPNVFDNFYLYGKASATFCHLVHEHHKNELSQVQHTARDEITRLTEALTNQQGELAQQEQALRDELRVANEATRQLEFGLVEQSRVSLEREQVLMRDHTHRVEWLIQQLQTTQTELLQLSQEGTARERVLALQTAQVRQEVESLLRNIAQRESEFAKELLQTHREADQTTAQQAHLYIEQERALRRELVERERVLTQKIDKLRQEAAELLHLLAQRESEFAKELLKTHREADQRGMEQTKRHAEREQALHWEYSTRLQTLNEQLLAKQEELRSSEVYHQGLERTLGQEVSDKQEELIQLIQTHAMLEAQLKDQIAAEQHATLLLQKSLNTIHASFTWRITAPLRWIGSQFFTPTSVHQLQVQGYTPTTVLPILHEDDKFKPISVFTEQYSSETPKSSLTIGQPMNRLSTARTLNELLSLHDQDFVFSAYQTLLGRKPDAEGLDYYVSRLRSGISKTQTIAQLALSSECKARNVQLPGLDTLISRYRWGTTPIIGPLIKIFIKSHNKSNGIIMQDIEEQHNQAAKNIHPPAAYSLNELLRYHDRSFVVCAYRTLLGREPDNEGLQYYVHRVRSGISKAQIIAQLSLSTEYKTHNKYLPGLTSLIRRYKWCNTPIVGSILRHFLADEGGTSQKALRSIENQIYILEQQSLKRFDRIDHTLNQLNSRIGKLHTHIEKTAITENMQDSKTIEVLPHSASADIFHNEKTTHMRYLTPQARGLLLKLSKIKATYNKETA